MQGCATTSLQSDMSPTWQSEVPIDYMGTGYLTEDEDRIIIGNDKDIYILDNETGAVIESMEEGFWESISPEVRVGGVTFDDLTSENYNLMPLGNTDIMLLFDYRYEEETITALDIGTGETIWQNSSYEYSLAKYSDVIEEVAERTASAVANALGGQAQTQSEYEKREQTHDFIQSIVYQVPESSDFLLKTFDGLVMMDGTDGSEKWQVSGFKGSGIADVDILDNGDFVVLGGGKDLLNLEMASAYHLARISPDGELQWMSEHSGTRISELHTTEDHIVVDGAPTEVFSLADGEKLWENNIIKGDRHHTMLVTDSNLYMAGDLESQSVQVGISGWVWEHDLDTGEIVWQTDETATSFSDLFLTDNILLAKGNGKLFGGNGGIVAIDANTGEELWTTPELNRIGGWMGMRQEGVYYGVEVTNPYIDEDRVYVAGPQFIYGIDLHSGDVIFEDNHSERGTGGTNGSLAMYDNQIIVVGVEAIVSYNKDEGAVEYAAEVESTSSFTAHDNRLVLSDGSERIGTFNLETGQLGPMMRSESIGSGRFGDFRNPFYIPNDASYIIALSNSGFLMQFPLDAKFAQQ